MFLFVAHKPFLLEVKCLALQETLHALHGMNRFL